MSHDSNRPGGTRRRNSVAPNPWRRGRRRPQTSDDVRHESGAEANHRPGLPMLAGLFSDASRAERAHEALFQRGYRQDDVVVFMAEAKWQKLFGAAASSNADEEIPASRGFRSDASRGPSAGGARGPASARGAAPLAITSNLLVTRVMAAGRIATMLTNAERPRHGDALVRALVDCGIPEREASSCAAGVAAGKILVGVVPHSRDDAKALGDEWSRESGEVVGKP